MMAKKIIRRFLAWLAVTIAATGALAQEPLNFGSDQYVPFGPVANTPDWQWFAPVTDETLHSREHEGYFFSAERLHWWLSKSDRAPVGVDSITPLRATYSPTVLHVLNADGSRGAMLISPSAEIASVNSIDSADPTTISGWGNRWELGWLQGSHGWMVSVVDGIEFHDTLVYGLDDKRLRQLSSAQGLDGIDGIDGDSVEGIFLNAGVAGTDIAPVAAQPGIVAVLPIDGLVSVHVLFADPFGLLTTFVDLDGDGAADDVDGPNQDGVPDGVIDEFDTTRLATVFDQVSVQNHTDLMSVEVMSIRRKRRLYHGGQMEMYLGVRYLEIDDRLDVEMLGGVLADSFVRSQNLNRLVGPQFGFRTYKRHGRWRLELEGRGLFAANFLSIRQNGEIGSLVEPGLPLQPNGLGPTRSFHVLNDEEFSPVGEFRAEAALQLTRDVALNVGWTGLFVGGLSRASNSVNYSLPDYGIVKNKEEAIIQGITFGLEVNR